MGQPLIRFHCTCGKRLAAPARFTGRTGECPQCGETVTVPPPIPETSLPPPKQEVTAARCSDPRLDGFYGVLREAFAKHLDSHGVNGGNPVLRFIIPESRRQQVTLWLETDDDREWLVVGSEIGTISILREALLALRLNRHLRAGHLYLDDEHILRLEHRLPADGLDDRRVVNAVKDVARWADEFEEQLFAIDVR